MVGIKGIRYVKRLILLAKSFSASSCCAAAPGSDPVRRRQSAVWLSTRVSTMGLHRQDARPCNMLQTDHVVKGCMA